MATFEKILMVGLQSAYDALATKDANNLYFCSDTRMLYKGADCYSEAVRVVTARPSTPAQGVIYVVTGTNTLDVWNGTSWEVIRPEIITSIGAASTDAQLPTAKAVYDYITQAIEDVTGSGVVVQEVKAGAADGQLSVKAGGVDSAVIVPGVVTTPTYDAATRKITLPVTGKEAIVIELGKDIFVDSAADNKYNAETGNIELHLNDGTMIEIPAESLVDVYTGGETTSAKVTVSDGNVITVDVKLSSAEGNAITNDGNGLFLSLAEYAKTADVENDIEAVDTKAQAAADAAAANKGALDILNGDAATSGSVANKVKALKDELDPKITAASEAAAAAQNTADQGVADAAAVAGRVQTLENAFGWGTF